jgi:hypothetical protein
MFLSPPAPMSLSVTKVRITTRKSVTSVCFAAIVLRDGKKIGRVTSAGDGSPVVYEPSELEMALAELNVGDAEGGVMRLLALSEDARDLRRRSKRRVLFVRDGILRQTVRLTSDAAVLARAHELERNYPRDVLNLLPPDVALEQFRALVPLPIPLNARPPATRPAPTSPDVQRGISPAP